MIKKLTKSVREYKKPSILTGVFVSLEVFLEVLIPFLMATLIDKGIDKGDMDAVVKFGTIIIVLAILALSLGALSGIMAAKASAVDYDARLKKLILTQKSLEIHNVIINDLKNFEKQLVLGISEEELDVFFKVLAKMKENIE